MRWRAHKLFVGKSPRGAYYEAFLKAISNKLKSDSDGYIDPYQVTLGAGGYGFDPSKDYLNAIPTEEMVLNPNLVQLQPLVKNWEATRRGGSDSNLNSI